MPRLKREHITGSLPSYDFTEAEVDLAIDRTRGWLSGAVHPEVLPDDLSWDDWADAVEIAILTVTNPEGFSQKMVGSTGRMWPMKAQRDAAIQRVKDRHQVAAGGPQGSYPPAPGYPDPASRSGLPVGIGDGYAQPGTVWIVPG